MSEFLSQGPLFLICLIFLLGVVVVIHELGHYLAGRYYGAAAESFSVGFGKSIFERTDKRGTRWRINWIPLGGFVKFVGEAQGPDDVGKVEQGLVGKKFMDIGVGGRSVIMAAGPAANFVLASLIFAVMAMVNGSPVQRVSVDEIVLEDGPAAEAGLQAGDVFLSINGKSITNWADFKQMLSLSSGEELEVVIERDGAEQTVSLTPRRMSLQNPLGQTIQIGGIGIRPGIEFLRHETYGPISAIGRGIVETGSTVEMTAKMLGRMLTGREPLSHLSGPVGIGDVARRAVNVTLGAEEVPLGQRVLSMVMIMLNICALVSVGIGLFNLLPLPVLDGGHLMFNAYEAVTGRVLPEKIQEASLTFGLVLLLGMAVLVTWGDILKTGLFGTAG